MGEYTYSASRRLPLFQVDASTPAPGTPAGGNGGAGGSGGGAGGGGGGGGSHFTLLPVPHTPKVGAGRRR